jgi:integrase
MPLFKQKRSKFWWYSFYFQGKRYKGSTGQTTKQAAGTVEAAALTALTQGQAIHKAEKLPMLQVFAVRFLQWSEASLHLTDGTRKFYRYGWRLLSFTRLATMALDQITPEMIDCTEFKRPVIDRKTGAETDMIVKCSSTYTNQALRTLKVMLGKAVEWKLIDIRPKIRTAAVKGRDAIIDDQTEGFLEHAFHKPDNHPRHRRDRERAWLVFVILQDTGIRPDEVFPMRIEHIRWSENRIWIPDGKTPNATRFVGLSHRMKEMLQVWCFGRRGWVFPSKSKSGHLQSIANSFRAAKERAGADPKIVPYSARHTFGTYTMAETGNTFAVSKAMGHKDIKSMEPYQHQDIKPLNEAINRRNINKAASVSDGHTFGHSIPMIQ